VKQEKYKLIYDTKRKRIMKNGEVIVDGIFKLPKVTRLEVIDHTGRAYVIYNADVELSYQDDGRTLKIFVEPKK
jgi:hypothetical protein